MTKFIIASNNKKKIAELSRILNPLGITALSAKELGVNLDEVEETGETFAENAELKASYAFEKCNMPSIADDSGLVVDALNGRPGVFTARYGGDITDREKYLLLLDEMKNIENPNRTARFVSSICCVLPDGTKITAEGTCEGKIAFNDIGGDGFGYDPIFIPENMNEKTFAQLSAEEKDEISHRGKALKILKEKLEAYKEKF